jgi:hypothetical protein
MAYEKSFKLIYIDTSGHHGYGPEKEIMARPAVFW